ncbi:MAG: uroporphyrinogen-III synthase [Beijerinckiaceae bacterium]|nr:uroporphyrinogen-III synthase [Beijerinckiaceae bacterium]
MLVLLTRALDESQRTAALLAREGHEAVLSPVIEMVPTGAVWPAGIIDGVIATSARAFELLSSAPEWPTPEACRLLPLMLVGERTREAARERGFDGPALVAPDAESLKAQLALRFAVPSRLVYLAGRDRNPDLEDKLSEAGHTVELVEVYSAQPADFLAEEALALAEKRNIGAVLHYSRRSADIFLGLARGAGVDLSRVNHVCISRNAAAPLLDAGVHEVLVAKSPNEQAMFAILNALAGLPAPPLGHGESLDCQYTDRS